MHLPRLHTDRLILRPLRTADATEMLALRNLPEVNRYINRSPLDNLRQAEQVIQTLDDGVTHGQWYYWAVERKEEAGLIGTICLWHFSECASTAEIGYEQLPQYGHKGYMGEALQRVLTFAFEDLALHKLDAYTHPENNPSLSLLQRNSFIHISEKNYQGIMLSWYTLLRSDWQPASHIHHPMNRSHTRAVLVVNLGSPDAPTPEAVKPYLDEFLMDERVIDLPLWARKLIVQGIILRVRPKKSAKAYRKIWWDEGSPLIILTERLVAKLRKQVDIPIEIGMRYGNPSIEAGLRKLKTEHPNLEEVFLIPLYPHYAMSSYETVVVKAEEVVREHFPELKMQVQPPFFDEESYLDALAETMQPHLQDDFDHFLFSYHGVPERHIKKGDPTNKHCLKVENCCEVACEAAHPVCYRHQVMETSHKVAAKLGLPKEKYTVCFQSRLGPDPWLKPATDDTLEHLGEQGVKNLKVACPAFVSDCLETLEEIGMEGKEEFQEAGGGEFTMIPCLNDQDPWVKVLAGYIHTHFGVDHSAQAHAEQEAAQ